MRSFYKGKSDKLGLLFLAPLSRGRLFTAGFYSSPFYSSKGNEKQFREHSRKSVFNQEKQSVGNRDVWLHLREMSAAAGPWPPICGWGLGALGLWGLAAASETTNLGLGPLAGWASAGQGARSWALQVLSAASAVCLPSVIISFAQRWRACNRDTGTSAANPTDTLWT